MNVLCIARRATSMAEKACTECERAHDVRAQVSDGVPGVKLKGSASTN